jgi:flagellar basal-body rod modification protein FlgD
MAIIGAPKVKNSFAKIKMGQRRTQNSKSQNIGEKLNEISGKTKSSIYVDGSKHNKMGKNEFLKLLTHQLANQDPMKPMDQKQMAADLAQFAQLEQLTNMNTTLTASNSNDKAESKYIAASFLGKQAVTTGLTLNHNGEKGQIDIPIYLPKNAKNLIVRIHDNNKGMIKQIELKDVPKGNRTVTWNGVSADKTIAGKGVYTVSVHGWDEGMQPFKGQTKSSGVVTSVFFEKGETVLELDGSKRVFLRDVERFKLPIHNENRAADMIGRLQNVKKAYGQIEEANFGR